TNSRLQTNNLNWKFTIFRGLGEDKAVVRKLPLKEGAGVFPLEGKGPQGEGVRKPLKVLHGPVI
ncbi:MAG: hypothetical protein EB068_05105, partial [Betaproteobacteria bacterium]|nr:hypothetical protein [Betaproteobacteria bacterium]